MRTRPLKPSFCTNEDIAQVGPWARLLLQGLWMMADRNGRLLYRPKKIKAQVFPHDDAATVDVESNLSALAGQKLIIIYERDGIKAISIPHFTKHARPHPKEAIEDIPEPEKGAAEPEKGAAKSREISGPVLPNSPPSLTGKGRGESSEEESSASETIVDVADPPSDPEADSASLAKLYVAKVTSHWGPRGHGSFRHLLTNTNHTKAQIEAAILNFGVFCDQKRFKPDKRPKAENFITSGDWLGFISGVPPSGETAEERAARTAEFIARRDAGV